MRDFAWAIEDIVAAHQGLYLEHCAVMAVALMSRDSPSPCRFEVECQGFSPPLLEGERDFTIEVSWNEGTSLKASRIWNTEQSRPIVERSAVALAALLFAHLIPDGLMRVTRQGDRADYWLPLLRQAVEISGTESHREITRRHSAKVRQLMSNPRKWNGYVFVSCISVTRKLIRWSYHTQEMQVL